MRKWVSPLLALLLCVGLGGRGSCGMPLVKRAEVSSQTVDCSRVAIYAPAVFNAERKILQESLDAYGVKETSAGLPLKILIGNFGQASLGASLSSEADSLVAKEGYRLSISSRAIELTAATPAGAFYGTQTLAHLLADGGTSVPACEIQDWPDLPLRMVMIDPARQNENFDYYRRLIRFCARQKINAILLHLTDDQTAALFEPNYPELIHPHAWKREEARALAEYARHHHIQLIPEIESCGHARMFGRRADYVEFLHQSTKQRKVSDWMPPDKPGYTNVLCPASEHGYEYVKRMVAAAQVFDSPVVHLGFDEVDMTTCARCMAKWPGKPPEYWFAHQLRRCIDIVSKQGKRAAVWGDMLLKHPDLLAGIDPQQLVIYDWQYRSTVKPDTSRFFTERGFDVVACPSVMCSPHIVLPDEQNYSNVRSFAKVARDGKLAGLNTTFWLPTRYLSGAMFPAFAYAGAQAWSGSHFEKTQFYSAFVSEHFGIQLGGRAFTRSWDQLATATIPTRELETVLYLDDAMLTAARELLRKRSYAYSQKQVALHDALRGFERLRHTVDRNFEDFSAIQHSAELLLFSFDYLDSVGYRGGASYKKRVYRERAERVLGWIMEDWNRNRYADDSNLSGTHVLGQNLALRFKHLVDE